jgi:hypothetical protein
MLFFQTGPVQVDRDTMGPNPGLGITKDQNFIRLDNLSRRAEKPEPGRIQVDPCLGWIKRTRPEQGKHDATALRKLLPCLYEHRQQRVN